MRLAIGTLVGGVAAAMACSGSPSVQKRTVTVHASARCAPDVKSAFALYAPLGDFPLQASVSLSLQQDVGSALSGFPSSTQEIVATITDSTSSAGTWSAHAMLASAGAIDLLALPSGSPCALTDPIGARTGGALGAIDEGHVLLAGGTSSSGVPTTALIDLTRGTVSELPVGLLVPRTNASVTAWSGGAVVAGGVQFDGGSSFEIYSSIAGDFDGAKYPLSQARARHGAVVMASGDTLLVGGVDPNGNVLGSMEAIDPVAKRAKTGGLGLLQVPRADPVVIRLASGEILVAGGVDAGGQPVSTIEWFQPDGSVERTRDLVSSALEAFIPLAAGGALAVIGPPATASVWVISADGGFEAAAPLEVTPTDLRFFEGTEQAPVLWTGVSWLVWQPWSGTFTALASAIGAAGPTGDPIASPEPGLGVWTDGTTVHALRFGATRGPYATDTSSPLLLASTSFTAPDRLVSGSASDPVRFTTQAGLTLEPGASVFLTDATFASFALDAQTPGKLPPSFVLRDASGHETLLDGASCGVTPGSAVHLERDAASVRASVDGGALVTCAAAPSAGARVSIGLRGAGASASVVRSLSVTRM